MTVTSDATVPGLGPLESAIMTVVWDAGQPLTVRAACERLNYRASDGGAPPYTTVMTVMNILWRKALLSRAKDLGEGHPRAWWYEARVTREDYLAAIIRPALECAADPAAVMRRAVGSSRPLIEAPILTAGRSVRPLRVRIRYSGRQLAWLMIYPNVA